MNRNLFRLLGLSGLLLCPLISQAQNVDPGLPGWVSYCFDPTSKTSPYSTDYNDEGIFDSLWGAQVGLGGTVNFSKYCFVGGFTAQVAGRVSFRTGDTGSIQDANNQELALTMGGGYDEFLQGGILGEFDSGTGGNWGIAKVYRAETLTGTTYTGTLFGSAAIDTFYIGESDRYCDAESTISNTRVQLILGVVGDAARCQWTLTNMATNSAQIGMMFGQWVAPIMDTVEPVALGGTSEPATFLTVPGQKPMLVCQRYGTSVLPNATAVTTGPTPLPLPPYVNFMTSQPTSWSGLQVITQTGPNPSGAFGDQTQCNGIDVGLPGYILGPVNGNAGDMPDFMGQTDDLFVYNYWPGTNQGSTGYLQKWDPVPVGDTTQPQSQKSRVIVAYYKTTWGDSDLTAPYAVVCDTPKSIATSPTNPYSYTASNYTLRVYLDNTVGFATVNKEVPIEDITFTLNLPNGLADVNDATNQVLTAHLAEVDPQTVGFVDFHFQALPFAVGQLGYSVTVNPASVPNGTKTISGVINVSTQPRMQILPTANLVSAPWAFGASTWSAIFAKDPNDPTDIALQPDIDYQAFGWDASQQQYVLSTGPVRGFGQWILSNVNAGFKKLNASPTVPTDLASPYPYNTGGAPLIDLKPGWNLVGNPYPFAIPLGQIVGISGDNPQTALTYSDMVNENIISGSLSFWDQITQSYEVIGNPGDLMQPNVGYWLFVLSSNDVTIAYPPVFLPFTPLGGPGANAEAAAPWKLNLTVKTQRAFDALNWFGFVDPLHPKAATMYKPPIPPIRGAVSSYIKAGTTRKPLRLAQQLMVASSKQSWTYDVITEQAGPATITWPNINSVPTDYSVTLFDKTANATIDLRKDARYTYTGMSNGTREFTITIQAPHQPLLSSVSVAAGSSRSAPTKISYVLTANATTTVQILQNGRNIATVASNKADGPGTSSVTWNNENSHGGTVPPGSYQALVTVTNGQGDTESQVASFTLR